MDLVLLIENFKLSPKRIEEALTLTYENRSSEIPAALESPPKSWSAPFASLAESSQLDLSLDQAFQVVSKFFDKITRSKK